MECSCGSEYERIAQHWSFNPSHRPVLSDRQMELCTGLLMGDGCLVDDANEGALVVEMKNTEFIGWLDCELGWLSDGYSIDGSLARLRTKVHPDLTELRGWYWTGEKRIPSETELTPCSFNMWYVSDGCLEKRGSNRQSRMRLSTNQPHEDIEQVLSTISVQMEYTWNKKKWADDIVFSVDTTVRLQRWLPESPIGFEHKYIVRENR